MEVEAARKLADLKKLDAMRIFLKKLDTKVYNGDYEVPVRLYFPNEEAMKTETSQGFGLSYSSVFSWRRLGDGQCGKL